MNSATEKKIYTISEFFFFLIGFLYVIGFLFYSNGVFIISYQYFTQLADTPFLLTCLSYLVFTLQKRTHNTEVDSVLVKMGEHPGKKQLRVLIPLAALIFIVSFLIDIIM